MLGYRKPMSHISQFLILFSSFFLSVHIAFGNEINNNDSQQIPLKLDLMHRHHPQVVQRLNGEKQVQGITDRIKDIHEHDLQRHRSISVSLNRKKIEERVKAEVKEKETGSTFPPPSPTPIGLKMISGSDFGSSEYFVELKIGTPPQTFLFIADTGSDLTWLKCRYRRCMGNCTGNPRHRSRHAQERVKNDFKYAYVANRSSTFRTVDCSSKKCKEEFSVLFSKTECPTPTSPCRYDYSYTGGPTAMGLFAIETLTVNLTNGKETQLLDSVIGCTESFEGKIFEGADGVMGLGTGMFSFTYKAAENAHAGGFSYCLVDHLTDHTATSYFVLGPPNPKACAACSSSPAGNATFTKLLIEGPYNSFYGVDLIRITIDGVTVDIPPRVWDVSAGGGTILDSGTSLTMLAAPAFDMVMEALTPKISKFERVKMDPFNYCFNSTEYGDHMAPKLAFHFRDGAVFEPPAKSYILSIGEYVYCVGIVSLSFPSLSVLGNILQQNHLWQFDFVKRTVSYAPSECM